MLQKIKGVTIGRREEFVWDIEHLVKIGRYKLRGKREFKGKGFADEGKNKVYTSIFKTANRLDSTIAIIEGERSTKRGIYKAEVSFYKDLTNLNKQPDSYLS